MSAVLRILTRTRDDEALVSNFILGRPAGTQRIYAGEVRSFLLWANKPSHNIASADLRGYTALHGAAYMGNNDMVQYLADKGGNVKAKSKSGDTVADMANGPTRFGQPHPETVELLDRLRAVHGDDPADWMVPFQTARRQLS